MGDDQWSSFSAWHEPLQLLKECSILVVPRQDEMNARGKADHAVEWLAQLKVQGVVEALDGWRPEAGPLVTSQQTGPQDCQQQYPAGKSLRGGATRIRLPAFGTEIYFLNAGPVEASSTEIRGCHPDKGVYATSAEVRVSREQQLTSPVRAFIENHHLYPGNVNSRQQEA